MFAAYGKEFDKSTGLVAADCGGVDNTRSWVPFRAGSWQSMEVLSGPFADLTLLLRHTVSQMDGFLPFGLLGLVLFVSVCLLLCQMIVYLWWKLGQVDELSMFPRDRGAIYRPPYDTASPRRRSAGSHYMTT
ncbi:unnamed protein product [Lota lota]